MKNSRLWTNISLYRKGIWQFPYLISIHDQIVYRVAQNCYRIYGWWRQKIALYLMSCPPFLAQFIFSAGSPPSVCQWIRHPYLCSQYFMPNVVSPFVQHHICIVYPSLKRARISCVKNVGQENGKVCIVGSNNIESIIFHRTKVFLL